MHGKKCSYFPSADNIVDGTLIKTGAASIYNIIDNKTDKWAATIDIKTALNKGIVTVFVKKVILLAIPFEIYADLWYNYRYEMIVTSRNHIDAHMLSQTIHNTMFEKDMIGPYLSGSVAMVQQKQTNKNKQCDCMTTLKPGDIKKLIRKDKSKNMNQVGPVLIHDVTHDERFVPAFYIQFRNFWPLREFFNIVCDVLALDKNTHPNQIIAAALKSNKIVDKYGCMSPLMMDIVMYDIDKTYVASSKVRGLPSYDAATRKKFTVTEYVK